MAFIPGHVYDKYLREEKREKSSEGDVVLVSTNKEHLYMIENMHIKAQVQIKTLKLNLG